MTVKIVTHAVRLVQEMMSSIVFPDTIHSLTSMKEELHVQNNEEMEGYLEIISEMMGTLMLMMVVLMTDSLNLGFLELMEHLQVQPVDMRYEGMEGRS